VPSFDLKEEETLRQQRDRPGLAFEYTRSGPRACLVLIKVEDNTSREDMGGGEDTGRGGGRGGG